VKILVADDSRVMRQIVTRTLRQAGFGGHDLVEAANAGAIFLIAKPFNEDTFKEHLDGVIA
jgi:two-component system chemotaxis response regulator CheY